MDNKLPTNSTNEPKLAPTASPAFSEAPASVTLKFDYRGYDLMLTLRDVTGAGLLSKLDPVLDRLEKMGASPGQRGAAPAASAAPAVTGDAPPLCPEHGTPMKPSAKKAGSWFCTSVIAESGGKKIYCQCKA